MRKITLLEVFYFSVGLILVLFLLFLLETPPTLRRIQMIESFLLSGTILIVGTSLTLISSYSIFKKESLFSQPKVRKIQANILVLTITVFVCLGMLEIFLQITAPVGCGQDDPILHHSYQPNCSLSSKTGECDISVKINSEGLRDEEIRPKENYDYRILMLGDSFTIGWGIDQGETFSDLLEQKFNSDNFNNHTNQNQFTNQDQSTALSQFKVDVINGGATSYSPILEYLFLKEKGLKYKPDLIILNFDLSDFQNDYYYQKLAKYNSFGKITGVNPEEIDLLTKIYLKVKLIKFIEGPFLFLDTKYPPKKVWGKKYFYDIDYDKYALTRLDPPNEVEKKYTETTFKYLKLIQQLASESNINFILVVYPYGHQISGEEWDAGRHNYGFEQGKVYSSRPEEILARFAAENNITFISLYPEFKISDKFPLYYSYDGHLNPEGHKLYADALYSKLLKIGISKDKFTEIKVDNGKVENKDHSGQTVIKPLEISLPSPWMKDVFNFIPNKKK